MPTGDQTEAKLFYAIGDGEWNEISDPLKWIIFAERQNKMILSHFL